jgi:ATP-dependent DNA helicase RecG
MYIDQKENQEVEFKSCWRDEFLKWICGFANSNGGKLLIGVNDSGKAIGLRDAGKLMEDIPNKVRDVLGILVEVNLLQQIDLEYIEIIVEPYPSPINFRGRYYIRSGSTNQELKSAALDRFLLKKQGLHWDGLPQVGLGLDDLNSLDKFKELASKSNRIDNDTLKDNDKNLLDKLHLYSGKYLKKAAALLFYNDPEKFITGAYIKIGFFETNSELIYQDEVHGNLFDQVDKTMDLVFTKYLRAYISYEGIYRIETFPVPREAFREGILNAVAHKDYSSGVPIQISVYDDKLMIFNNGFLHTGWTVETLLGKHSSQPYNPDIANAFFRTSLIEAWGRGIEKIQSVCENAGVPKPEISFAGGGLWVKFAFNKHLNKLTPGTGPETGVETKEETVVKTVDKILLLLSENPEMSLAKVASRLDRSVSAIEQAVKKLRDEGSLVRIGSNKSGYWKVINTEVKTAPETSPEMSDIIIRILSKNPSMTLKEVAHLVNKSSRTIERIVKKLKKDGKIDRIGPKKGGYWKVIED